VEKKKATVHSFRVTSIVKILVSKTSLHIYIVDMMYLCLEVFILFLMGHI
jgi:hypothetical protein